MLTSDFEAQNQKLKLFIKNNHFYF